MWIFLRRHYNFLKQKKWPVPVISCLVHTWPKEEDGVPSIYKPSYKKICHEPPWSLPPIVESENKTERFILDTKTEYKVCVLMINVIYKHNARRTIISLYRQVLYTVVKNVWIKSWIILHAWLYSSLPSFPKNKTKKVICVDTFYITQTDSERRNKKLLLSELFGFDPWTTPNRFVGIDW